jgi:hypothetical protein
MPVLSDGTFGETCRWCGAVLEVGFCTERCRFCAIAYDKHLHDPDSGAFQNDRLARKMARAMWNERVATINAYEREDLTGCVVTPAIPRMASYEETYPGA